MATKVQKKDAGQSIAPHPKKPLRPSWQKVAFS
jgi:hypothetical protein